MTSQPPEVIVGSVVGGVVLVGLIIFMIWYVLKWRARTKVVPISSASESQQSRKDTSSVETNSNRSTARKWAFTSDHESPEPQQIHNNHIENEDITDYAERAFGMRQKDLHPILRDEYQKWHQERESRPQLVETQWTKSDGSQHNQIDNRDGPLRTAKRNYNEPPSSDSVYLITDEYSISPPETLTLMHNLPDDDYIEVGPSDELHDDVELDLDTANDWCTTSKL